MLHVSAGQKQFIPTETSFVDMPNAGRDLGLHQMTIRDYYGIKSKKVSNGANSKGDFKTTGPNGEHWLERFKIDGQPLINKKFLERLKRAKTRKKVKKAENDLNHDAPCLNRTSSHVSLQSEGAHEQNTPEEQQKSTKAPAKQLSKYGYELTPPRYWDVDFPTPEEQKEQGLIIESDSPLFKERRSSRGQPTPHRSRAEPPAGIQWKLSEPVDSIMTPPLAQNGEGKAENAAHLRVHQSERINSEGEHWLERFKIDGQPLINKKFLGRLKRKKNGSRQQKG